MLRLGSYLCLTLLFFSRSVAADEAVDYSGLLHQQLVAITSLSATFEQVSKNAGNGNRQMLQGQLQIAKPNLFRIETHFPSTQALVSNGVDFWSFDGDLEQLVISRLNTNLDQVPVLLFTSDLTTLTQTYAISGFSDEGQRYFLLEPRSEVSLFRSLTLTFNDELPASIQIRTETGEQVMISLTEVKTNIPLPESTFEFSAPGGIDVIDDR